MGPVTLAVVWGAGAASVLFIAMAIPALRMC